MMVALVSNSQNYEHLKHFRNACKVVNKITKKDQDWMQTSHKTNLYMHVLQFLLGV